MTSLYWAAWIGFVFASLVLVVMVYWGIILHRNLRDEPSIVNHSIGPPNGPLPLVSVVIPAKDEEEYVERSVSSVLALTYPRFEVIVVNDRSRDGTGQVLARLADADDRLAVETIEHLPDGWTGKTHALYQGSKRASGDLLLFTDADTVMAPDALDKTVRSLIESDWGMVSLWPGFLARGFCENIVHPHLLLGFGSVYQPREVNNGASTTGLASGSFILMKRSLYQAVGTWERFRSEITEDVALSKAVKRSGERMAVRRAGDLVKTRGFSGLLELQRFWTRTFYGGFDRSALTIFRIACNYVVLSLLFLCLIISAGLAVAGMATTPVWAMLMVSAAAVIALIGTYAKFTQKELGNWVLGLTAPVGILVSAWITFHALEVALSGRGIRWRGSSYK